MALKDGKTLLLMALTAVVAQRFNGWSTVGKIAGVGGLLGLAMVEWPGEGQRAIAPALVAGSVYQPPSFEASYLGDV